MNPRDIGSGQGPCPGRSGAARKHKEIPVNRICAGERGLGCLLVHGLTGGSHDLQPLARALQEAGYPIVLLQLPGHGTSPSDLAGCSWRDWHEATSRGLRELERLGKQVAVIGLSMGSLLALDLAHAAPGRVACVVALSTALHLQPAWLRRMSPLLAALAKAEARVPPLRRALASVLLPKGSPDISLDQARTESPSYRQIPLRALMQLILLQQRVTPKLPHISQPILIIHGSRDRTCPPSNAELLASRLGSKAIRKVLLEQSAHVVTLDTESRKLEDAVIRFLNEVGDSPAAQVPEDT